MAVPSSTYTELVTTTLDNYRKTLADNILTHNPLLERIKRKGNAEPVGGGVKILENLMYAENSTKLWYSGLEYLNIVQSDVLSSANFDWKELNINVVISGIEKAQNSGTKEAVFNLLKSRINVAEITMQNEIASALFYSNTENSGKSIGGLQHLVMDLPTGSTTIGGINQSTQSWWRNQYYDFSAESITPSATTIQAAMNRNFINSSRGKDNIDIFVADTVYFNYYLTSLQSNQRFMGAEEAGAGFKALKFWGGAADVFFDSNCPASHMYGINTDYIHYRPHTNYNFVTLDDKVAVNQDATVVPMYWKGNLTVSNRSLQSVICA